jgi:hypothetical protein
MAGIIAKGIAGAAGAAQTTALEMMKAEIMRMRDESLAQYGRQAQERSFAHAEQMQRGQQEFRAGQREAGFAHDEQMLRARQQFEREQAEASRFRHFP